MKGWICDDSGNAVANGATVRHHSRLEWPIACCGHGGDEGYEKIGNAMWHGKGTEYWEFKVLGSGGFWLGVTTVENFGPSYGIKGLFFGGPGNLMDGSSGVKFSWGPEMEEEDVIGMRLKQKDGNITLAFSKNGKGLGTAFDIQGWDEGTFIPAVSLQNPGQGVTINEDLLNYVTLDMNRLMESSTTIEGKWKPERPGVRNLVLHIKRVSDGQWTASCHVVNSMTCFLEGTGPEFKAGGVRKTCVGVMDPQVREFEREMGALISGIARIVFDFGAIVVTSRGNTFRFKEFIEEKKPATKETITWMRTRN